MDNLHYRLITIGKYRQKWLYFPPIKHFHPNFGTLLDILVSINGNRLVTSVFYKPTHSHSYLLYSSSHPNHTKRSIPFPQFLRLRRLCSEDEDFHTKSLEIRDFFVQHGYPTSLLDTAFSKASQIPQSKTLIMSQKTIKFP